MAVIDSASEKDVLPKEAGASKCDSVSSSEPSRLELESVDYFVSFVQMMGLPKSIGQIYGLLFMSFEPIPMDVVISKLKISKGSASQGLNLLRELEAVKTLRREGDRRDFFEANFDVTRIVQHFLDEKLFPRLNQAEDGMAQMRSMSADLPEEGNVREMAQGRLEALNKWQGRGRKLLPLIRQFFRR